MSAIFYSINSHMVLYLFELLHATPGPITFDEAQARVIGRNPVMRETTRTQNTTKRAMELRGLISADGYLTKWGRMTAYFLAAAAKAEGKSTEIQDKVITEAMLTHVSDDVRDTP